MADAENGQELDPLQDDSVGDFNDDAEVSLDDPVDGEGDVGGEAELEDPVSTPNVFLFYLNPKWLLKLML